MGLTLLCQGVATAASVGMGCGTCCSPGVSIFLSGYTMAHAKSGRQAAATFCTFYLGKIISVIGVCMTAALIGNQILDENGCIAGINVKLAVNVLMAAVALYLISKWIWKKLWKTKGCKVCRHCKSSEDVPKDKMNYGALFGLGFGYGISPCAPLIMMTGYAVTLPVEMAGIVGGIFALASSLSPMLLMMILSGMLAAKFQKEMISYLDWFQMACYVLLLVFSFLEMV